MAMGCFKELNKAHKSTLMNTRIFCVRRNCRVRLRFYWGQRDRGGWEVSESPASPGRGFVARTQPCAAEMGEGNMKVELGLLSLLAFMCTLRGWMNSIAVVIHELHFSTSPLPTGRKIPLINFC